MDNYKGKRADGYNPRNAGKERSFDNDFNGEYRKKPRPRFNRDAAGGGRPQFVRVERRDNAEGDGAKRYGSSSYGGRQYRGGDAPRYGRERFGEEQGGAGRPQRRYDNNRPRFQGGFRNEEQGTGYSPRGAYDPKHRGGYGQRQAGQGGAYNPNAKYSKKKQMVYREAAIDPDAPVRLNKYLSNAGICSRREADEYIQAGLISVNGVVVSELGTKVLPGDDIRFSGERVNPERKVYVLLNKPKDCVTTVDDPQERRTVLDCLKGVGKERIYPVGRLDRNTTGVLLLTNDGDLASRLTHPKYMKKKVYHVTCDKNVAMSDMDLLVQGIELEDGPVYADEVSYVNDADRSQIGIEIHSGKNRIVRRMMEHLGYHVVKLDRVLFAGLTKKNLKRGDWRYLTEKEIATLRMGAYE